MRERVEVPARRLAEQGDEQSFAEPRDLADRVDPAVAHLARGDRPDAPEPFDRERVEEVELAFGWHDEQAVGFGDTARDLGEELGAGHADGDRQPDPFEHLAAQADRDLGRRARDAREAADVEERLVDREPFDQRCRVVEHREHGPARFRVRVDPWRDDDRVRAAAPRLAAVHRGTHAERLGFVARSQHHSAADDDRLPAQAGIVTLLDRRVERVEVGVEDRGTVGTRTHVRIREGQHQPRDEDVARRGAGYGLMSSGSRRSVNVISP